MSLSKDEYTELCDILVEISELGGLEPKDQRFVDSLSQRVDKYKDKVQVSPAQWSWLRDILARCEKG